MPNWAKDLEAFGIPSDRVKLVERNLELRNKLKARGDAILGVQQAHHQVYKHEGPSETCLKGVCEGLRDILRRTEP